MSSLHPIIEVDRVSKQYRLGEVSTGTLAHDLNRWWSRIRGKEDPTLRVTHTNERARSTEQEREFVWALNDINFEVHRGEVLGIIGRNGAGKSTLLKLLSRVTAPTAGEIRIDGSMSSLLEVGTGFHPELTGRENIFLNGAILGMSKAEVRQKLDEIVEFSGCARYLDTPVKRYSSGMIVRLGFAIAAHLEPDILVIDEVLAVGDIEFQKKCLGKMKDVAGHGRTVLFVSHNMAAVQNLCSRVVWLENGRVRAEGATNHIIQQYEYSMLEMTAGNAGLSKGFIYEKDPVEYAENQYVVTGVELLNEAGEPMMRLSTWDYVKFRIHYHAKVREPRGSVVLAIQDAKNVPLMLCSTEPDSNVSCEILAGDSYVDCVFSQWPLTAGECLVNASLAITGVEYLTSAEPFCRLQTYEKNIYNGSFPPRSERYQIAADHTWEIPLPAMDNDPTGDSS